MDLISPEFDFRLFCRRVPHRDPIQVMDAAGMESSLLHREYRERTGRTFRRGSKQQRYCDNLQCLVYMLMNGAYPGTAGPEFFGAVVPLVTNLLERWQIGNLRDVFSPDNIERHEKEAALSDPFLAVILKARDAGRAAADDVYQKWRRARGEQDLYDYMATAVLHLSVPARSPLARQLAELSASYPHLLRVDRDFGSSGLVIAIHDMVRRPEQSMHIAAEEAALKVLEESLEVEGYVTSYES